jgi:hypothetical protein
MKAGGKILDQERQEQQKKAAAEQQERPHECFTAGGYADFDTYGGTLRSQDPDLFDVVLDAIRFFRR